MGHQLSLTRPQVRVLQPGKGDSLCLTQGQGVIHPALGELLYLGPMSEHDNPCNLQTAITEVLAQLNVPLVLIMTTINMSLYVLQVTIQQVQSNFSWPTCDVHLSRYQTRVEETMS